MKKLILILLTITVSFISFGKSNILEPGFLAPEAVTYDQKSKIIYVSNINGNSTDKDNNGFISKLNKRGKPLKMRFIEGGQNGVTLNAPKGSVIIDGKLVVTDIDHIRGFDLKTGAPLFSLPVEGAAFLNDICSGPEGVLYFTDTGTSKVHKLSADMSTITTLADGTTTGITGPNGIIYDEMAGNLLVLSREKKQIFKLNLQGEEVGTVEMPAARLDGIVKDGQGNFYITSWETESVYRLNSEQELTVVAEGLTSPADLGIDRKGRRLLVPQLREHKVVIINFK